MTIYKNVVKMTFVLGLVLMAPLNAWAKNRAAYAEFVDETDTCISTEVFVHARSSGNSKNVKITLSIDSMNMCNEEQIALFKIDKVMLHKTSMIFDDNISTASLSGTVTVVDKNTKKKHNLKLDLLWTGNGEQVTARNSRDITESPSDEDEIIMAEKHNAVFQEAIAEGSIDLDAIHMKFSASRGASIVMTE